MIRPAGPLGTATAASPARYRQPGALPVPVMRSTVLAEIGDPARFASARALAKHAGPRRSFHREARTVHVLGGWLAPGHAHLVSAAICRTVLDLIASIGHD